jgi:hypothetical protein
VNIAAPVPTPKVVRGRMVLDVPGLRLESLTNGNKWERFRTSKIKRTQCEALAVHVLARALRCPLTAPLDVTIIRQAPGRFDSDNMVACGKYVRDWLAKWIGIDDKHDHLVRYLYEQEKTKPKTYGVRIVVESRRVP